MNRIVRENYPVADLPAELRSLFPGGTYIRLVMEPVNERDHPEYGVDHAAERVLSLEELFAMRSPPYRSTEDIVADVRRQRDEWDD